MYTHTRAREAGVLLRVSEVVGQRLTLSEQLCTLAAITVIVTAAVTQRSSRLVRVNAAAVRGVLTRPPDEAVGRRGQSRLAGPGRSSCGSAVSWSGFSFRLHPRGLI